ncbi:mediator of RNA polymerase II transcription subunit 6-like [Planococcus citri]|uniref:mediator of RNA polymerase II transcription subunit 6-like n=1 Tax=Planococcus citri TaxID=170843 RepID=UPI0031F9EB7C
MMPGRVPCVPTENPLSISWHDSAWVPMVNSSNVLDYFSERSNPFYDRTCNNETLKMQRLSPDQLVNMTGLEYTLLHVQEPILYVIRKQHRTSPTQSVPVADYYIIAGTVYQAPDLISVVNSRLLTTVSHLQSAFDDLFGITKYQPSKGYSWDVKTPPNAQGTVVKKDIKEEPSSNFQRQRVDMLLMELTRRFPPPVVRPPAMEIAENNVVVENPPVPKQEPASTSQSGRTEIKQESRDEPRPEQPVTSPSMKPPPEKKPRLT